MLNGTSADIYDSHLFSYQTSFCSPSISIRRSGSGAQRDKKQLAKKLINSIQSSSETSGPEQQLTVLITWQNDALHLKCSFASKNWSWPNWMNPACWRILLCNIYNTKRENDQLKSFLQLRETLLYLTVFRTVQCTWYFSLGMFLCAASVRVRASSTRWLANRSWIWRSRGRGTSIYTAFDEANTTLPERGHQK